MSRKDRTNQTKAKTTNTEREETALPFDILPLPDPRFKGRLAAPTSTPRRIFFR
jgi:hypothetical protein